MVAPLRANPGGQLAIEEIVGRSMLVDQLLETLERRSVVLTGERRLGKTTVATLLQAVATERGWTIVKLSVEGMKSDEELAAALTREVDRAGRGAVSRRAQEAKQAVEGATIAGLSLKASAPTLESVIRDAHERVGARLLIVLDELPILVRTADLKVQGSGAEVLHVLRRLRQDVGVRMLMLGSIGFHHALKGSTGVLNDVASERILPLDADDATELACRLLKGEGLCGEDVAEVAAEVARQADRVPYYIHSIVEAAKRRRGNPPLTVAAVDAIVNEKLSDGDDWNMRHFRERMPDYYGGDTRLAAGVLDVIAAAGEHGADLDDVVRALDLLPEFAPVDRGMVQRLLTTLADDHYVVADSAGRRRFAFDIVRRAWIITGR